ncbi:cysteine dioxygenase family protein [Rhodopila globiformis]|uniref:Cysteine dioxygenase n=1 Tax=Rhodopila globiformis TaxID=1071 RepID=A0A2S6MWF3_RHOGL|nr:cysteine dioxygenase [Rhodopila globiformis]PPQ26692.1 cysteine dioxygenase [Rhodopila globiformis]
MCSQTSPSPPRLGQFIAAFTRLLDTAPAEDVILQRGGALLATLVAQDDWLPEPFAAPDPLRYRQYLLHCDRQERFCVVSFVWGPGQRTPVHNHTVWGLVGMLRGKEIAQDYTLAPNGHLIAGKRHRLSPGQITAVSPRIGDIHTVENALPDSSSVSIHVYGANIGTLPRTAFDLETGAPKTFISGYAEPA